MACPCTREGGVLMEDLSGSVSDHEMATHIRETKEALCEIEDDMKHIMEKEEKDMTEGFDSGMLAGLLSKQGVDPGIIAMLNDRRDRGDWGDGGMLVILFLILIMGGGNGFWGNRNNCAENNVEKVVFDQSNYDTLMSAIGTNAARSEAAVNQLASTFNCTTNQIQMALAGVDKQLAVNNGDIINSIQSCCCQQTRATENQGCQTRAAIADQGAQTRELLQNNRFLIQATASAQDNLVQSLFCQQNQLITDKFNALELRDMQRSLDEKNERINDLKFQLSQEQQTAAIVAAMRAQNAITFSGSAGSTAFNGTGTIGN